MSTVSKSNFEPVGSLVHLITRDVKMADATLLKPTNSVALVDGEWVTLDANYKGVRASTIGAVGNLAAKRSFPVWSEKGRTDGQVLGAATLVWLGEWEFETAIFDASVALGSGAAITAVMQPVKVATITIGSRNYSGLVGHGGSADTDPVVGYVTRLGSATKKMRVRSGYRQ